MSSEDTMPTLNDNYLKPRKKTEEWELRLFLKEVNYHCPLCGKLLQSRNQKKPSEKKFQIAHIFPNSPTTEQYRVLSNVERLGASSESFENKIALCKDCHGTQDYHTTLSEYEKLLNIKKELLILSALQDATLTLGLENEIKQVIDNCHSINSSDLLQLNYNAITIANKFSNDELILKTKISGYIFTYYIYIRDLFNEIDGLNGFKFSVLSKQIHACFEKMSLTGAQKSTIFNEIVSWVKEKTNSTSTEACEAVISFFVQNCEVFHENSK